MQRVDIVRDDLYFVIIWLLALFFAGCHSAFIAIDFFELAIFCVSPVGCHWIGELAFLVPHRGFLHDPPLAHPSALPMEDVPPCHVS